MPVKFSDVKGLKELSLYITLPLFICAYVLEMKEDIPVSTTLSLKYLLQFARFFLETTIKVMVGVLIPFGILIWGGIFVQVHWKIPVIPLVASFILAFALAGLFAMAGGYTLMPLNNAWYFAFASAAFLLFQVDTP